MRTNGTATKKQRRTLPIILCIALAFALLFPNGNIAPANGAPELTAAQSAARVAVLDELVGGFSDTMARGEEIEETRGVAFIFHLIDTVSQRIVLPGLAAMLQVTQVPEEGNPSQPNAPNASAAQTVPVFESLNKLCHTGNFVFITEIPLAGNQHVLALSPGAKPQSHTHGLPVNILRNIALHMANLTYSSAYRFCKVNSGFLAYAGSAGDMPDFTDCRSA